MILRGDRTMVPTYTFYKAVDDIEMYCELFSRKGGEESLGKIFRENRFESFPENLLILLHGNGEDGRIFSNQTEAFCREFTVLTVDSRGQGKTTAGTQPFSIDLLAEDFSKLCDELGIGKFSLLGFSDGANVALTYAVRHPERLCALIAAGANLNPQGLKTSFYLPLLLRYRTAEKKKKKDEISRVRFELLSLMVNYPHISHRLLSNIACPVLVMDGQKDLIRKSHTDSIAQSIPKVCRVTVPDAGHTVFCDNAAFVNRTVLNFLKESLSSERNF